MRTGICITLKPGDRRRLAALARDRNAPHKHVWRAEIVRLRWSALPFTANWLRVVVPRVHSADAIQLRPAAEPSAASACIVGWDFASTARQNDLARLLRTGREVVLRWCAQGKSGRHQVPRLAPRRIVCGLQKVPSGRPRGAIGAASKSVVGASGSS